MIRLDQLGTTTGAPSSITALGLGSTSLLDASLSIGSDSGSGIGLGRFRCGVCIGGVLYLALIHLYFIVLDHSLGLNGGFGFRSGLLPSVGVDEVDLLRLSSRKENRVPVQKVGGYTRIRARVAS